MEYDRGQDRSGKEERTNQEYIRLYNMLIMPAV
jgi:hypothetical protein